MSHGVQRHSAWAWAARVAVPVLLVVWLMRFADRDVLLASLSALPAWSLCVALALGALNMGVGAVRWGLLMRALGARSLPAPAELARGTLIGHFYNTFVPGSVGGDLVRAYVMRPAFDTARTGLALVVGERLLGLSALALMAAFGALMGPSLFDGRLAQGAGAGLAVGVVGLGAAAFLWRGGHLERLLARAPAIHRPADIAAAWGVSVVGHALNIALYTQLAVAMRLPISAFDIACVTPLALIASVIPLAFVGVGAREVALVVLLGQLGVASEPATVLSLGFSAVVVTLGVLGGLLQLLQPSLLRYH